MQGDSIVVEIDLEALMEALGGAMVAGDGYYRLDVGRRGGRPGFGWIDAEGKKVIDGVGRCVAL